MIRPNGNGLLAATALLLLAGGVALAEPLAPERELDGVEQQLEFSRSLQARIAGEIAAALAEQEEVAQKLVVIARDMQSREAAIAAADVRIQRLVSEAMAIRADL